MSKDFQINVATDGIEKMGRLLSDALGEKQLKAAMKNSINRGLLAGRTIGVKMAREKYTATARSAKSRFGQKIEKSADGGALIMNGKPGLNLYFFMPKPRDMRKRPRAGVSVKIKRQGGRYVPKGSLSGGSKPFIAPIRSGGLAIFVRYGRKKLEMLHGPSPIQALQNPAAQKTVADRIAEAFEKTFKHEVDGRLAGFIR